MIRSLESAIKNKSLYEHISSEKLSVANNYFEVLSDKYSMRPFVDLDGEFTDDISKEDFEAKDNAIIERLKELENASVMTSSHYEALKITKFAGKADKKEIKMKLSYRVIWINERVNNIVEMKKIIKEQKFPLLEELLSETIEITEKSKDNAVNVDYSVYRQGDGKMRCVNAFKHPEQPERINKLVKGSIEDTFININQDELDKYELLLPQTEKQKQEREQNKIAKQEKKEQSKTAKQQAKEEEKIVKKEEREKKKDDKLENIIKQHKEKKEKKQKDKDEKEIDKKIKDRVFTEEQIIELLSIIGNTADWQQWNNYGLILHDNWYSFDVFNNWSKLNKKYPNDIVQNKNQWNTQYPVATGKWAIYTFLKDAKINNPEKYKEWCKKCKQPHILSLLKQGADAIDEEYKAELFKTLKFSQDKWYACDENTNLWIELSTPEKVILTFIRKHMEDCEEMMKAFEVGGFLTLLKKCFEISLSDNDFHKKLSTPIDHIAFKNGLYNLKTKVFQKGFKPDNFISKTLDYDFDIKFKSNEKNKKYIITEFVKLCSNKEELLFYLFCIIGFILTGRASEMQQFYSIIGQKGGNGKSTLFIILKQILNIYVKQTSPKCFEADYAKAHKDLATLQGIRFLVSEEFRKGASLNEQLVKRFRDGTPMENEVMFGTLNEIDLQCKLLFTSNSTLKFEADGGMSRGYREVKFSSRFVEDYETSEFKHETNCFQADKSFQTDKFLQPEYRDELLHILFEYSDNYYKEGLKTPKFISEASQQTCEMQGDQFKTFFDDYYMIDPEGFVLKEELTSDHLEYYKKAVNLMQIKDEFQKISDLIIYDKNKKGKGENCEKRGGFRGISKKETI
jgi:phage/plasmid-associated DNA primase